LRPSRASRETPAPLRFRPVFRERIWAGSQMASVFGYDVPEGHVGECWGVSARPDGPTVVGGPHDGGTLLTVWEDDRAFFGNDPRKVFPLLVKFLDVGDWLSVQVHPDDAEALRLEGVPLGKTECWYVVAAVPGAEIILGHRARDADELAHMIEAGRWDDLLLRRQVHAGDFVHIPSGTIHSAGPGLIICEVQQNCDTTYRLYDFDRRGDDGAPRDLHIEKAEQVVETPFDPASTNTAGAPERVEGGRRTKLVRDEDFQVDRHEVDGPGYSFEFPTYELVTVTNGRGRLAYGGHDVPVSAGDHLILPAGAGPVAVTGAVTLISSRPTSP